MLKNTFVHIPGVSQEVENKLWGEGIITWEEFLERKENIFFLSNSKKSNIINELVLSKTNFENGNLEYFQKKLPKNQHWRCIGCGKIAYIDIETTGLSKYTNKITTIGVYDGENTRVFINGIDLEEVFEYINQYDIIVTFNGKQFDVPFIEYYFNDMLKNSFHLDLRYLMRELGYRGGLKVIEKNLNIVRDDEVEDIDGFEAVKLWKRYEKYNCENSLNKLVQYNIEDIVNLEKLLKIYLSNKIDNTSVLNSNNYIEQFIEDIR